MASQGDNDNSRTLKGRLLQARLRAAVRLGYTVSQARMADLVGQALGKDLDEKQWRRWENGESEPRLDVIKAAARVSELSPEYIAFGKAPEPDLATTVRTLTPDEIARAEQQAADETKQSDRKASRKAAGRGRK